MRNDKLEVLLLHQIYKFLSNLTVQILIIFSHVYFNVYTVVKNMNEDFCNMILKQEKDDDRLIIEGNLSHNTKYLLDRSYISINHS